MLSDAAKAYRVPFAQGLLPEKILRVSEWADQYRFLSTKASAEPGRWRTDRTPYLKEIMDSLSTNSDIEEVIFKKGAQIGASESAVNWAGYVMHWAPGPMMIVQPTTDLAETFSTQRITALIEDTPALREVVAEAKSRDSQNTKLKKEFRGGVLVITGANSPVSLRSMPVKYLVMDEVDGYPLDVGNEGSPVDLARARTRTFSRKKIFMLSTPTIDGQSMIDQEFQNSDQRYYFVPCPHCKEYQRIEWANIRWEENAPETAMLYCVHCGTGIDEHHKTWMLDRGEWRATNPVASKKKAGFHLSSLYSPVGWYSWADAAEDWVEAQKSPEKLKSFVNTVLGECWAEKGSVPEWRRLYERREQYKLGTVAERGLFLTCGADVQKDRIEAQVIAWGKNKEFWLVDYRVFMGDTSTITPDGPWAQLSELINEEFTHANGQKLPIKITGVDSGYNTQVVYEFVRKFPPTKVIATKGSESLNMIIAQPRTVDVHIKGKAIKRGAKVWNLGVNLIKSEIYGWLKQESPTEQELERYGYPPGFGHFPQIDEEYFRQLCAEQVVRRVIRGYPRYIWEKVRERNEALDTLVIARAVASLTGIDRFEDKHWDKMAGEIGVTVQRQEQVVGIKDENKPRKKVKIRKREDTSGFW